MTKIGYAAMLEQFHPTDLLDYCAAAEDAGFAAGLHGQRALPSVDAAAGPERVRLVVHGRARDADHAAVRDGGDVPRLPLPPGRDRPRRGDARGDVPGPLLAGARRRRGAQRARHRRRVAGGQRPQRDDVRGDRDHQQAVHRQRRQAPRRRTSSSRARSSTRARRRRSRSTSRRPGRSTPSGPASSPTG